jgi:hypothetical protein
MGTVLHATKTKAAIIIILTFFIENLITALSLKGFALPPRILPTAVQPSTELDILDGSGCATTWEL